MKADRTALFIVLGGLIAYGLGHSDLLIADSTSQGRGILAQTPMELGDTVEPNFIMAVDDSGSMTFQTLLPGRDGAACWSDDSDSFFESDGDLRTSGECEYNYVLPGARNGNGWEGIPPLDQYGFARSPDFNPSYYDPTVTYEPWVKSDLSSYGDASISATKLDPRYSGTVNLFSSFFGTDGDEDFRVQDGMWIPSGVKYGYEERYCDDQEWWGCRDWDNRWVERVSDGFTWGAGEQDIAIEYTPGLFYLKEDLDLEGYTAGVKIDDACGAGCDLWRYAPNTTATKQNFANWFSYYGNRNRAMIAGLTRSFVDVDSLRVGYFTINGNYGNLDMLSMSETSQKAALYEDMLDLDASGSTPNAWAVEHIGKQFMRTDDDAPIQSACQRNAGMLFTDGYSNQGRPTGYGDIDPPGAPFQDEHSNTMADIASYYYSTNLRTDLPDGQVRLEDEKACEAGAGEDGFYALDCNDNLHMNFFGITLGAKGDLFGVTYGVRADGSTDADKATEQVLGGDYPAWPAWDNDDPSTVDDIWHATINTRGRYINASTPANITAALREVIGSVGAPPGPSGSIGVTGARLNPGSLAVTPGYSGSGTDWHGSLLAEKPVRTGPGAPVTYDELWNAAETLKNATTRNLYFGVTTAGDVNPEVSAWSTMSDPLVTLCSRYPAGQCGPGAGTDIADLGVTGAQALDYLAGNQSLESGDNALRKRTTPLGDIVGSTPVVVSPTDNYGYTLLRDPDEPLQIDPYDYREYLTTKSKTRDPMVYVGANDGMLHAFHGDTGAEVFGYVPAATVGYMGNLLFPNSPQFQHRYYVDGPIAVSDARWGGAWHTVLVGTTGAGSRSIFAIDITDADSSFTTSDVLWEINPDVGGEVGSRIGHVLGKPVIVPVRGADGEPEWKAIFGSGFDHDLNDACVGNDVSDENCGNASLFIVDINTGEVEYLDVRSDGGPGFENGLANLVALDRFRRTDGEWLAGSDGMVDIIYAGDLHGNVWKFDITQSGDARVAFDGNPLFIARDGVAAGAKRQPITGGLEAAVGPLGGVMVLFGTGSFIFQGDKQNTDIQTIYGVLDKPEETDPRPLDRSYLTRQSVLANGQVTSMPVDYFSRRGWFIDLAVRTGDNSYAATGERIVGNPRLEGGTLFIPSYEPNNTVDPCTGGGANYLYGVRAITGKADLDSVMKADGEQYEAGTGRIKLNTKGSAPVKDVAIYSSAPPEPLAGGVLDEDILTGALEDNCDLVIQVAGAEPMYRWRACGRQSWRQVR